MGLKMMSQNNKMEYVKIPLHSPIFVAFNGFRRIFSHNNVFVFLLCCKNNFSCDRFLLHSKVEVSALPQYRICTHGAAFSVGYLILWCIMFADYLC